MKVRLWQCHEKEINNREDLKWIKKIVKEKDDQAISEEFLIGWDASGEMRLEVEE